MVKITIPSSSASLTTKGTAPVQSPSSFSQEEKAIQNLGGALAETSDVFRQNIVNEQVADAQILYTEQLNKLKQETLADPNLTEASAVQFGADAIEMLNPILDTIGDPAATRQFEVQQRATILGTSNSVRQAGRNAQQDRYVVKGGEIKTQSLGEAFAVGDPVMQKVHRKTYTDYLDSGVPFNITREERERQIAIYDEEFRVGKPQHDFDALTGAVEGRSTVQRVLGALDFISGLDQKYDFKKGEAESWKNVAEGFIDRQIKNVQQEVAESQQETARKVMDNVKSGEGSVGQIKAANANDPVISQLPVENPEDTGALSNADLDRAIKLLAEYKPKTVTNNAIWGEIRNNIDGEPSPVTEQDGTEAVRPLTSKEIDDKIHNNMFNLDEEDFQELKNDNIGTKKTASQQLRKIETNGLKGRIKNSVIKNIGTLSGGNSALALGEGLSTFSTGIADEYASRFQRKAIKEKLDGEELQKAANDMYDEFLKDNGLFIGKGKTANVVVGIEGEVKRLLGGKSFAKPQFRLMPVETGQEEEQEQ